jgi:hypothetical protein
LECVVDVRHFSGGAGRSNFSNAPHGQQIAYAQICELKLSFGVSLSSSPFDELE